MLHRPYLFTAVADMTGKPTNLNTFYLGSRRFFNTNGGIMRPPVSANIETRTFFFTAAALLLLVVTETVCAETSLPVKFGGLQPFHPAGMSIPHQMDPAATAAVANTREVVLSDFESPPRGAYPAVGVVRDSDGNLYGTTNGAYSDVPGGGSHNAGVVFKVDMSGNETVLYTFTGGADGSSPNGVILDSAGNLYGTTSYGGASSAGVVFKVDTSGHETVLYSFTGQADGANPNVVIRDAQGNLYGTTSYGGASGAGVVFKVDSSGHETVLYAFTGGNDGGQPFGGVAFDAGSLYGTTNSGGTANSGVVFKVDKSGHESVLHTFRGGADGAYPNGVILDLKGNLYGTTTNGGGASGAGVVFKVDSSGHEKVLYSFTGGDDGANSDAGVVLDSAGNVYGTTSVGGASGLGVVFKVDRSGNETVLHAFTRGRDGNQPDLSGVILDSIGNLYGTTAFGGTSGQGTVYKLDSKGNDTVLYAFPGAFEGQYPYYSGVIFASDGESECELYGATFYGGSKGAGIVYRLDGAGDETVLYSFDLLTKNGFGQPIGGVTRDSEGNLYGTTFIGPTDVGYGNGVLYKLNRAGQATVLHNFTGGVDGGGAYGSVILDSAGNLYGTTNYGGASGAGVVYTVDTSSHQTILYSFTGGPDGGGPLAGVIRDSAGNLYGTTAGGGAAGAGVVFKIDPTGNETVLYSFTGGPDGGSPLAAVIRDKAGNLYGTTDTGGASDAGVVFKVDTSGKETVLYSFTGGADGGYPVFAGVLLNSAGNLYGTTAGGGKLGAGVVYKIDTSGKETVLYSFTGGADGYEPTTGVTLGPKGNLYGTTALGGRTNAGVVFEIKP